MRRIVDHGPERCHRLQCSAAPCRSASNARLRHITRLKAYGRWHPWVDADLVREHIAMLREWGFSLETIQTAANVSPKAMSTLIYGINGQPLTRQVKTETATRIFAVRPDMDMVAPSAQINAAGTRRRIQALCAIGWTQLQLGPMIGIATSHLGKITHGHARKVKASTAVAVRDLYEQLWNSPPAARTPQEAHVITRARLAAARNGWAPPLAWDDDTIDDPNSVPEGAEGEPQTKRRLPDRDDLQMLIETGSTVAALAQRFGVEESSVKTTLRRCGLKVPS